MVSGKFSKSICIYTQQTLSFVQIARNDTNPKFRSVPPSNWLRLLVQSNTEESLRMGSICQHKGSYNSENKMHIARIHSLASYADQSVAWRNHFPHSSGIINGTFNFLSLKSEM